MTTDTVKIDWAGCDTFYSSLVSVMFLKIWERWTPRSQSQGIAAVQSQKQITPTKVATHGTTKKPRYAFRVAWYFKQTYGLNFCLLELKSLASGSFMCLQWLYGRELCRCTINRFVYIVSPRRSINFSNAWHSWNSKCKLNTFSKQIWCWVLCCMNRIEPVLVDFNAVLTRWRIFHR